MKRALARRLNPDEQDGLAVSVSESVIRVAAIDAEKERAWYRALAERAEEFGFTKTLKCLRRGRAGVDSYLEEIWSKLAVFAKERGVPFLFTKDKIAFERAAFRADFDAKLAADEGWLYFDLALYCGSERITLEALRAYLASGERYMRRADGTLVTIQNKEDVERLVRMLEHFEESEGRFSGRAYHAPELQYLMSSSPYYDAKRAESLSAFMRVLERGKPVQKITFPRALARVLRPYQKTGVEWLHFLRQYRFGGILADDVGLGKTLQTLALLSMTRGKRPSLIVCPKTLLYNWAAEAAKFTPDLRTLVYAGAPAERIALRKKFKAHDLIVTSYPIFKRDEEFLTGRTARFAYAVLDEAQHIKNHASKNAYSVKKVNAEYRLALTGTPMENHVGELWSIFDFLMPGFLGNHEHFSRHFHRPIMEEGDRHALEHLRRKTSTFMLRRTKAEVLRELPPKIEQRRLCELGEGQSLLYQQILAKVRGEVFSAVTEKGFQKAQIHILAGLTKLRQACNHPALLTKKDWHSYESAKLEACLELAEEITAEGRKMLIFSQFTSMLDIIAEALAERGIAYQYLSGKTRDRQTIINSFNADPAIPVFLISLKAGGVGLNLTAADTVIVFDPWWNQAWRTKQLTGRIASGRPNQCMRIALSPLARSKRKFRRFRKRNSSYSIRS